VTCSLKVKPLLAKAGGLDVANAIEHEKHSPVFENLGAIIGGR
jgi:hypothetical protein